MNNPWLKAKYSFISALVFYIVANPETYKLTEWLLSPMYELTPPVSLLLHTVLFFAVMWGLMMLPAGTI